jgi:IclR family transcriptional regulator, acetate operon repressor
MPAMSSRRARPHPAPGALSSSDRVLQLLAAVAQHGSAVPVKRLAELAKLPASTVYRHLALLKRWGFIAEGERDGTYEPGPMSLQLGWGGQTSQLVKTAHDELQRLVETTGESAGLMVTINDKLVCLDLVESPQSLRCSVRRGTSLPLLRGASAKAQLAFLPERERSAVLDRHFGATAAAKRRELERELATIRHAGYAVSEGEVDWGVWGVSVPLMNRHDRLLGGITLMAPSMRVDRKHKSLIHATVTAAGRIAGRF